MKRFTSFLASLPLYAVGPFALAGEAEVIMHFINSEGVGQAIGTVRAVDSPYGLMLIPQLKGLPPGVHGFHVHQNGSCEPKEQEGKKVAGLAAGGHLDTAHTGKHEGPIGKGHLGDLPALVVNEQGEATLPVIAPRLRVVDLKGRSLMVHAGGDNYSDQPQPLGGGGARIACAEVE